jgi:iron complex outermembrane receptor protein
MLKQRSLEELMDIDITTVAKRSQSWFEAPAAVHVISSDDIKRSGASSIPEALRLAHNLQVAQRGSHAWAITGRGFNTELANKLLVMIDGRTIYTPLFSGVFWDRQDYLIEDIDRIEVISGPGGTLWGANAVNGVINIITRNAEDAQGLYAEAGGGSMLKGFGGVRYGGEIADGAHYRIYGKYFDRGSQVFPDGKSASDSWHMGQGGFRVDGRTSEQSTLTLQGDFYVNRGGLTTGGEAKVIGGNALGRWSHEFSGESDATLQLYYDRTHLFNPVPPFVINSVEFAPAGTLIDDLHTYDFDFQYRFQLGENNHVVWGVGYRFTHDVVQSSPFVGFLPATLNQHLFSGFIQSEIALSKDLFFTIGTKLEHNGYTGWELEPSSRVKWDIADRNLLWAAISRAVRTPSRIDRDVTEPTPPYFVFPPDLPLLVGGTNFKSETVIAYELGYRSQIAPDFATSVSVFYNSYDDLRSTSLTAVYVFPLYFENNLEGETYGVELNTTYNVFDWWRLHAGYSLLKEDIRTKPGTTDFNNAMNETADPEHQFTLRSSMDLPHDMGLETTARWIDILRNYNGQTAGTVPSYWEVDLCVRWQVTTTLRFSVVGQNLIHDQHPEYGFPNPTRVEIQRSVYGKLSYTL